MSQPWWQTRDPDLGRDRATLALGRRDYNWFAAYADSSVSPSDVEPAQTPWAGHTVTPKDRYDRTLGIPPRQISMWPDAADLLTPPTAQPTSRPDRTPPRPTPSGRTADRHPRPDREHRKAHRAAADQILNELQRLPAAPSPIEVSPPALTRLLDALAPAVHGRSSAGQYTAITTLASAEGLPPAAVLALARDTGTLIAKTTHAPAPDLPGDPNLNRLLHADRTLAAELLLARARLAFDQVHSDPDLPRLWILANALHHAVPAHIVLTQPATSHGPAAELIPTHDDLVGWRGISTAVTQLRATITAAHAGRAWLAGSSANAGSASDRILALGVLALTHPATATELAAAGPASMSLDRLRRRAERLTPTGHVTDLTDAALKATCDRNSWLLGTPDERTARELVERDASTVLAGSDVRAALAAGHPRTLAEAVVAHAPTDIELDAATWRTDPPALDAAQRRHLLDLASRQALHQFAGLDLTPHATRAAALAARFPQRLGDRGLVAAPDQLLTAPTHTPSLNAPAQLELEL